MNKINRHWPTVQFRLLLDDNNTRPVPVVILLIPPPANITSSMCQQRKEVRVKLANVCCTELLKELFLKSNVCCAKAVCGRSSDSGRMLCDASVTTSEPGRATHNVCHTIVEC